MPLALYARCSTVDQHPDAQLSELRAYAERRGITTVEFVDHGVSGRRDSRPALDALLAACRRREVDAVAVVRLDRLARSLAHMARLGEEFSSLGVEMVSLREGIDTSSAMGRAMFGMCAVFAQLEGDLISDRTKAGLDAAKRRGARIGRPRALDRRGRARLHRLRRSGKSLRECAELLGCGLATCSREARRAG